MEGLRYKIRGEAHGNNVRSLSSGIATLFTGLAVLVRNGKVRNAARLLKFEF
jgi:hypothetical protein